MPNDSTQEDLRTQARNAVFSIRRRDMSQCEAGDELLGLIADYITARHAVSRREGKCGGRLGLCELPHDHASWHHDGKGNYWESDMRPCESRT